MQEAFREPGRRAAARRGSTPARTSSTPPSPSRAARPGESGSSTISATRARSRGSSSGRSDEELARLMSNLGGHDLPSLLARLREPSTTTGRPCSSPTRSRASACPSPGHKDNHAGPPHAGPDGGVSRLGERPPRPRMGPVRGAAPAAGGARALSRDGAVQREGHAALRARRAIPVPTTLPTPKQAAMSTQQGFGLILSELARSNEPLADAHRHDLARRDGLDQSRRLGQPARPFCARRR